MQVLDGIAAAHKIILAYEAQEKLNEWGAVTDDITDEAARQLIESAKSVRSALYACGCSMRAMCF